MPVVSSWGIRVKDAAGPAGGTEERSVADGMSLDDEWEESSNKTAGGSGLVVAAIAGATVQPSPAVISTSSGTLVHGSQPRFSI